MGVLDDSCGLAGIDQSPTPNSDQFIEEYSFLLLDSKVGLIIDHPEEAISDGIGHKPSLIEFKVNVPPLCRIITPEATLQVVLLFDLNQLHLALFDVLGLTVSYLTLGGRCPQFITVLHPLEYSQMRVFSLRGGKLCY
jgi:hypothetical protein